jgi:hypothetical protein
MREMGIIELDGWSRGDTYDCHFGLGHRRHRRKRTRDTLMAMTLEKEQRLQDAQLVQFFENERVMWSGVLKRAYSFTKTDFPKEAKIRRDDLIKPLLSVVEINEDLRVLSDCSDWGCGS